jgi:hypothetical protein
MTSACSLGIYKMPEQGLSFDEITSVHTLESLFFLYRDKSFEFDNQFDPSFIDQISSDWQQEVRRLRREAFGRTNQEGPGNQIPCITLDLDGKTYSLFGVYHTRDAGSHYFNLVSDSIQSDWLIEQNLQNTFPNVLKGTEVFDWCVSNPFLDLKMGLSRGAQIPQRILKYFQLKKEPDHFSDRYVYTLFIPLEAIHAQLPAYVDIQLRERTDSPSYTNVQKRSAYQAEFMRALQTKEPKILTGGTHSSEIQNFLINGVKDSKIIEKAQKHAALLDRDLIFYFRDAKSESRLSNTCYDAGFTTVEYAYALGASLLIGTGLYKLIDLVT